MKLIFVQNPLPHVLDRYGVLRTVSYCLAGFNFNSGFSSSSVETATAHAKCHMPKGLAHSTKSTMAPDGVARGARLTTRTRQDKDRATSISA